MTKEELKQKREEQLEAKRKKIFEVAKKFEELFEEAHKLGIVSDVRLTGSISSVVPVLTSGIKNGEYRIIANVDRIKNWKHL